MSGIPHSDGPYGEITAFGAIKATALELVRRTLEARDLGWISALTECRMYVLNGEWRVDLRFLASSNWRYGATVTLELRNPTTETATPGFPVSHGLVALQGVMQPDFWSISPQGVITRV